MKQDVVTSFAKWSASGYLATDYLDLLPIPISEAISIDMGRWKLGFSMR
jgi:hypothetical protein